jgi:hypothetical protein
MGHFGSVSDHSSTLLPTLSKILQPGPTDNSAARKNCLAVLTSDADHISECLEAFFLLFCNFFGDKILKFFDADPGWKEFGSGMEKLGSGIKIPDPQHWD